MVILEFYYIRVRATQIPIQQKIVSTRKMKSLVRQRFEITTCEARERLFKILPKECGCGYQQEGIAHRCLQSQLQSDYC